MKKIAFSTLVVVVVGLIMSMGCYSSRTAALAPSINMPLAAAATVPHTPVLQEVATKARQSWPWYLTRGAGLTAAALLILLILSGIGLVTGFTYRFLEPIAAWSVHRALGIAFGVSACVHVFALLFDKYVGFSLLQLLIPFSSHYKPVTIDGRNFGSLYVALGIFAFYLGAIVIYSSLFWKDTKPYLWRALHFLSYLLVILTFFHALYLGTDFQHGLLRALWVLFGIILFLGIIMRLRRSGTLNSGGRN